MWPTTQEENKLLLYGGDLTLLGPAEQFLIELIKIDHVYDRLDCLYFMSSLQEELTSCREAFSSLEVPTITFVFIALSKYYYYLCNTKTHIYL
jgi:Formin Homology 2 Domain